MGLAIAILVAAIGVTVLIALAATPEQAEEILYGQINHQMICPHCTSQGKIRTKLITQKKGISGGKATAALFTGGISMLATGLSRKENNTQAHCTNCNNTWLF